jgi:hypothetical protein
VGTTLATIPADVPYLHADPAAVEAWRAKLDAGGKWKVGIVWAGRATHDNDRNRSLPAAALAPLEQVSNVHVYSLQKGATAPTFMIDRASDLHDFADTAAAIAILDLVISVDTSVAHLAGAMGKPVWTLLPHRPEWRWMLDREDSPWYPTMRLFRQSRAGDWAGVIARVCDTLRQVPAQGPGEINWSTVPGSR